jgi:hypothetical protein
MDLKHLSDQLAHEKLTVELAPESRDLPFAHIKIALGPDEQKREIMALLWPFSKPHTEAKTEKKDEDLFIQIFIPFPFPYVDESLLATARYILMVNKVVAFPGFGLSEPDHALYYKYTLCFPRGRISAPAIIDFLGAASFLYDAHAPLIEEIASGRKSFEEIVNPS